MVGKRTGIALTLVAISAGACGKATKSGSSSSADAAATSAAPAPGQDYVVPPSAYFDAAFAHALVNANSNHALGLTGANATTIYLNFDGTTISQGYGAGQSFILCQSTANIPPAGLSATDQETVISTVQQFFTAAGVSPTIVTTQPSSGDYKTVIVGGTYSTLGCSGGSVVGVAPLDTGDVNPDDIAFAFPSGMSDEDIGITIAHELGHTFGLQHVTSQADIMYPEVTSSITGFTSSTVDTLFGGNQNEPQILQSEIAPGSASTGTTAATPAPAATTASTTNSSSSSTGAGSTSTTVASSGSAGSSAIPGLSQILNLGSILGNLGGELGSLGSNINISSVLSGLENLLPTGASSTQFPGLSNILGVISGLASSNGAGSGSTAASSTPSLSSLLGDLSGLGSLLGSSSGLSSLLSSLGNFSGIITTIEGLFSGLGLDGGGGGAITSVPDLVGLLGLNNANLTQATLIQNFQATVQAILSQYSGSQADALLTLLKGAYLQKYQSLSAAGK